jgi:glycosyltransferase involved in cell wall biosynthesis
MRILVHEAEFDFKIYNNEINKQNGINSNTSVNDVKAHFFETLEEIGTIIKISNNIEIEELQNLCNQEDVIFASFHEEPPLGISCRLLNHTKGSLMLTGGFLNRWTFMKTTMNIVTSHQQAKQLTKGLGKSAPLIATFISRMNNEDFKLPSKKEKEKARELFKLKKDTFHIVFGGRFIANKGIVQIVRALNLWPQNNIKVTLVGNFEQDFFIYQSNASHATFPVFFEREIVNKNQNLELICLPSMKHEELCNLFWSADCFIFPSFHEDEAIGTTPRLAMLCGVPVVATDFSGFGQLKETNTRLIKTYATLGGVRFSLKQILKELTKIRNWTKQEKNNKIKFNSDWLLEFGETAKSKQELKNAIDKLLKIPLDEKPKGGWRSKERFESWINDAPKSFKDAVLKAEEKQLDGLYVDGLGYATGEWFSEAHFLQSIQSLYTTYPDVPQAKTNNIYRGFWRLSILECENGIIEFGFPGPRILRFKETEFELLKSCIKYLVGNDVLFEPLEE